tara:strand:- start:9357 stop:9938 length:582 start_codon:yes stop_codon:yes gene_type:complete
MATIYDLLEAPVSASVRRADELALGSVQAQLDAVPTAGASERDVANLVFSTRVGGVPGSGSNLLRSREAASTANQIRAQNRAIAADRATAAAAQMGEFAMRASEESAYAESVLQELRAAGVPGDRIIRQLNRLKATMTTDAGRAYVDNLIADEELEYAQSRGKGFGKFGDPVSFFTKQAVVDTESALGEAFGE